MSISSLNQMDSGRGHERRREQEYYKRDGKHRFEDGITIKAKEVSKTGSETDKSDGKTDFLLIAKK